MSGVSDDALLAAYRWYRPVGLVASLLLIWGFAADRTAFLFSAVLYIFLAVVIWEARRRAGGSKALAMWTASRGWRSGEFTAGQGVEPGSEMFNELVTVGKAHRYSVADESPHWRHAGWTFTRGARDIQQR